MIDIDKIVRSTNCLVKISGWLEEDMPLTKIFMFEELSPIPKAMRIDSVIFAIQEKLGFNLWWVEGEAGEKRLILPLESRGYFNFEPMQSLQSKDATGIAIESFNLGTSTKTFLILLDMVKQ